MKSLPLFVSILALIWAASAVLRVPGRELTWAVPACVIGQLFFALMGLLALERTDVKHPAYANLFSLAFFAVLMLAMIATARFLAAVPYSLGCFVIIGGISWNCAVGAVVYWRLLALYPNGVPHMLLSSVWQAAILSFCGSATLLSLAAEHRPTLKIAALSLGIFWQGLGSFLFAFSIGIVRTHAVWSTRNRFIPAMLAICCFGYLAYRLTLLQSEPLREVARQTVEVTQ